MHTLVRCRGCSANFIGRVNFVQTFSCPGLERSPISKGTSFLSSYYLVWGCRATNYSVLYSTVYVELSVLWDQMYRCILCIPWSWF